MNTIIPKAEISKIILTSGGKPAEVNNPHIDISSGLFSEGVYSNTNLTTIDLYFKLFDTYSTTNTIPLVDEQSLKYIKINIYYFYDQVSTSLVNGIQFYPKGYDINLAINIYKDDPRNRYTDKIIFKELKYDQFKNLINFSIDNDGNQYFEINYSQKVSNIPNDVADLSVFILPTLDLNKIAEDFNISVEYLSFFENSQDIFEDYAYKIIKQQSQYLIDQIIINDIILEDINIQLDSLLIFNTSFLDSKKQEIPLNLNKYFGNVYISRKSNNTACLIFEFDPILLIKEQTLFGTKESIDFGGLDENSFIANKFLEQSTVNIYRQKVIEISTNQYEAIEEKQLLDPSLYKKQIINRKNYYIVNDEILKNNSSTNCLYQYEIEFVMKDITIDLLSQYYYASIEGLSNLENYYKLILNPKYYDVVSNKLTDPDNSLPTITLLSSYIEPFYAIYGILKILKDDTTEVISLESIVNLLFWNYSTPNNIKNVIDTISLFLQKINKLLKINKIVIDKDNVVYTTGVLNTKTFNYKYTNELLNDNFFFDQKVNSIRYLNLETIDESDTIPKYIATELTPSQPFGRITIPDFTTDTKIYDTIYDSTNRSTGPRDAYSLVANYYENKNIFYSSKELKNTKTNNKLIISVRNGIDYQSNINNIANQMNCTVTPKRQIRVTPSPTYSYESSTSPAIPVPRRESPSGLDIIESSVSRRGIAVTSEESIDINMIYGNSGTIEDEELFQKLQNLLNTIFLPKSKALIIPEGYVEIYNNGWTRNNLNLKIGTFLARIVLSDLENESYAKAINDMVITNKYFLLTLGDKP